MQNGRKFQIYTIGTAFCWKINQPCINNECTTLDSFA